MRLDFAEGSERARSMATWVRGRLWGFGRGGKEGREEGEVAGFWLWGFGGGGKRKGGRLGSRSKKKSDAGRFVHRQHEAGPFDIESPTMRLSTATRFLFVPLSCAHAQATS
jgi:hypothetical protein